MATRALIREADLKRAARVAREERVAVCVELQEGTRYTFGGVDVPPGGRANGLDDAL